MKVYKFRSLGDCQSLERAEEILRTGKFWCSRFWELNDPMEGYYLRQSNLDGNHISEMFGEKSNTLICSFSNEGALTSPTMWGYYANGFKGVAVELEVSPKIIRRVEYCDDLIEVNEYKPGIVKKILTRKLTCWTHEEEVRVFKKGDSRSIRLGEITGIIVGTSYPKTMVNRDVDGRQAKMRAYNRRVDQIRQVCHELEIPVRIASMKAGKLEINNWVEE